jgi:hypothetical protein
MATQIVMDHTGLALLRSWLTVEQEGQYDSHKQGRMMNR